MCVQVCLLWSVPARTSTYCLFTPSGCPTSKTMQAELKVAAESSPTRGNKSSLVEHAPAPPGQKEFSSQAARNIQVGATKVMSILILPQYRYHSLHHRCRATDVVPLTMNLTYMARRSMDDWRQSMMNQFHQAAAKIDRTTEQQRRETEAEFNRVWTAENGHAPNDSQ